MGYGIKISFPRPPNDVTDHLENLKTPKALLSPYLEAYKCNHFPPFNLISIAEDEESILKKELHDYKEGTKQLLEKMRELQGKSTTDTDSIRILHNIITPPFLL